MKKIKGWTFTCDEYESMVLPVKPEMVKLFSFTFWRIASCQINLKGYPWINQFWFKLKLFTNYCIEKLFQIKDIHFAPNNKLTHTHIQPARMMKYIYIIIYIIYIEQVLANYRLTPIFWVMTIVTLNCA